MRCGSDRIKTAFTANDSDQTKRDYERKERFGAPLPSRKSGRLRSCLLKRIDRQNNSALLGSQMRISRTLAFAGFVAFLAVFDMNRLWSFPEPIQLEGALAVSRQLDLAPGLARILAKMGLVEERRAREFLFPRLRDLRDPLEIGGMQKAVDRIFQVDRSPRDSRSVWRLRCGRGDFGRASGPHA